jgi:hypothetical protein
MWRYSSSVEWLINPNSIYVVVTAGETEGMRWTAQRTWIDHKGNEKYM